MPVTVADKLLKVAADIAASGCASLTRLTVLKKWLQPPDRLSAFALFIAQRACARPHKVEGDASTLFAESSALLADVAPGRHDVPRNTAINLHTRLHAFQDEYQRLQWGSVRIIQNRDLYLIEEGLRVYLWRTDSPADGYRLAAAHCEHHDPQYGNHLSGPSRARICEIVNFIRALEAREESR